MPALLADDRCFLKKNFNSSSLLKSRGGLIGSSSRSFAGSLVTDTSSVSTSVTCSTVTGAATVASGGVLVAVSLLAS